MRELIFAWIQSHALAHNLNRCPILAVNNQCYRVRSFGYYSGLVSTIEDVEIGGWCHLSNRFKSFIWHAIILASIASTGQPVARRRSICSWVGWRMASSNFFIGLKLIYILKKSTLFFVAQAENTFNQSNNYARALILHLCFFRA